MVLGRLFKERPAVTAGRVLYGRAVDQARRPAFYATLAVPDTVMGRFELYTLHTLLLVLRLKGRSDAGAETVQALFDAYIDGLDIALRELGIGDLSMGKKMKKLGRAFYGRVGNWRLALDSADPTELEALIARTVYAGADHADAGPLARYARRAVSALAEQPDESLLQGHVDWPEVAV